MSSYRLALPHPWEHIPVGGGAMVTRVDEIVGAAVARLPKDVPPDQVAQARIKLTGMLQSQLLEAERNGAVDYYVPTDLMHGIQISASFLVTVILPDASAPEEVTGPVLARLLSDDEGGAKPVTVGDTVWARTEGIVDRAADELLDEPVRARKVEYITAIPGDERHWIIVSFSTLGDGDPDSAFSLLMVELFDAIMSTWRWQQER